MTHKEIHQQLPDYVLGLLTPFETHEVTQHLADCTVCRRTVQNERKIGALVRTTLNATTRPDEARLRQLMPPIPQKNRQQRIGSNLAARLAPALVILFMIAGSLLITVPDSKRPLSIFFAATATATSTNTPTATAALESSQLTSRAQASNERITDEMPAPGITPSIQVVAAPAPLQSPTPNAVISRTAAK